MLFSLCKEQYQPTSCIRYELWVHQKTTGDPYSYTIKKQYVKDNTTQRIIISGVKNKEAVMNIWSDILTGVQK